MFKRKEENTFNRKPMTLRLLNLFHRLTHHFKLKYGDRDREKKKCLPCQ